MGRTDGGDTAIKHTQRLRLIRDVLSCACGGLGSPAGTLGLKNWETQWLRVPNNGKKQS